ncbi:hypothetical protein BVC80_633g4 [Macleaya cordata]|uniref:PHD-type zinc finger plants domain-containing protein n=1 Tax=Macleaya cordata TaxID=56857 RepID=A0A200QMX7_MACCD|nr:hypothetical protein BVC80_633g4 [Macleaya cordata]
MVDPQNSSTSTVCCMCGDIGFSDKLFRCTKCCHRFQHSYCSNYYDESTVTSGAAAGLFCDWCLSEEKISTSTAKPAGNKKYSSPAGKKEIAAGSSSSSAAISNINIRSDHHDQYSGDQKIKQNDNKAEAATSADKAGNSTSGTAPSPKTAGRRYKFLKDVMC